MRRRLVSERRDRRCCMFPRSPPAAQRAPQGSVRVARRWDRGPDPGAQGAEAPAHGGTTSSLNWSGYAVTPGSGITAVNGTFTVPSAGLDPPGFAATWAGIGGYNTSDLIQAGVEEQSAPEQPLDGPSTTLGMSCFQRARPRSSGCSGDSSCTVTPGDHMTSTSQRLRRHVEHLAHRRREVELEQGCDLQLHGVIGGMDPRGTDAGRTDGAGNVGTVPFGPTSTYTAGGTTHTIAAGAPTQIDLGTGVVNEATPSALASDGQSFNDCAYALSCPAP